jgi:tetratricopeptide (TPR) repeat protein/predicted Ser/Thr protein kinase
MVRKSDRELPLANTLAAGSEGLGSGPTIAATDDDKPPPSESRTLDKGTTIDERYVVDSVIGRGGMGTVYLARDTQLGRDVALKLHRHGSGDERLYREAVAMAQLSHPNVVTVYEVGTVEDQLFVAMEYIPGKTLRDWCIGKSWREIVELLVEAAEGLVAAHRKGMIHRDFKPENVLVDPEGRPRVSDFGLARSSAEVLVKPPSMATPRPTKTTPSLPSSTGPMTVTGAILGTPAYMAPEQYAGTTVDARSDQFSFCVATWELAFGSRPFQGSTLPQLQQAIERGDIAVPEGSPVPASVRRALRRGLAARPEQRWPDLPSLLEGLRAALKPRRIPLIAVAVAGMLAVGGVLAYTLAGATGPDCAHAGDDLDQLLPPALRQRVIAASREAGPTAGSRATHNFDAFTTSYKTLAVAACHAVDRHDWSADLAEQNRTCRREQLRRLSFVLEGWLASSRSHLRIAVGTTQLTQIADLVPCGDPNVLATLPQVPPELRDAVADARGELLAQAELEKSADFNQAAATADRIANGPIGARPELAAPLGLVRAGLAHRHDLDEAIKELTATYYAAHAHSDQATEIITLRDLLYWIGNEKEDAAGVDQWYRLALSEVDRFERLSRVRAAELRTALVGVAITRNELPVAVEQARRAVDELADGPPLLRTTATHEYASALAESGEGKQAIPVYEKSVALAIETLGPDDPQIAEILGDEALTYADIAQYDQAVTVAERAMALVDKSPDYPPADRANLQLNLASVLLNADKPEPAEKLLHEAKDTYTKVMGVDNPAIATIDSNLALIENDRGHHAEAEHLLRGSLAIQEKTVGPDHPDVATTLYNIATTLRDAGDLPGALEAARRCAKIRAASLPKTDLYIIGLTLVAQIENLSGQPEAAWKDAATAAETAAPRADYQAVAWPQVEQARALIALGRDRTAAKKLLADARTAYAANHNDKRVGEIDVLLAKLH